MAMDAYVGSFQIDSSLLATETQDVTDTDFQPKALIFWSIGRTDTINAVGARNVYSMFGVCSGATDRSSVGGFSETGVGASDSDRIYWDSAAIVFMDGGRAIDGRYDLDQFLSNGFRLVVDDQFSADYSTHYLALGGDSITNTKVGIFQSSGSLGTQDVDVGFVPDFVLFFNYGSSSTGTGTSPQMHIGIGAAVSASQEMTIGYRILNSTDFSDGGHYVYSGECTHKMSDASTATDRAEFVQFINVAQHGTDGFRLNWLEVGDLTQVYYLAIKGGDYAVGSLLTRDDGEDITESVGFQPAAAMFFSAFSSECSQDTPAAEGKMSIGAFSALNERGAQSFWDEDNKDTTEVSTAIRFDAVYASIAADATIEGLMDVKEINSSGFKCVMDDPDPSAKFVPYIAFGPGGAPPVIPDLVPIHTRRLHFTPTA